MKTQNPPIKPIRSSPVLFFAIFLLGILLFMYHDVFNNFFFTDDGKWLLKVQHFRDDPSIMFQPIDGKLRPLAFLVLVLEYSVFGHNPRGYFYVNFFVFYVNALLAYFFIRALCQNCFTQPLRNTVAFFTSFLFAIQAMVCVPVLWISLIHDLLNTTFYLLCLLTYLRYNETQNLKLYILSFLFFALSLTTKETGASLPAVLVLVHVFIYKNIDKKTCVLLLPHFLAVMLFLLHYPGTPLSAKSISSLWTFTTITLRHIVEAVRSLFGFSQNKTLWLQPEFSHALFQKMFFARIILGFSLILLIFASSKTLLNIKPLRWNIARIFVFCIFWMVLTFLPHFPLQHLILWDWVAFSPGYHYFYLSTLGLCFLVSVLFTMLLETCSPRHFKIPLLYSLTLSLFLNSLFPILHMEKVYSFHAATLHYLLDRIHSSVPAQKDSLLYLANFPSQYQSLHYNSLLDLVKFFNPDIRIKHVHWIDKERLDPLLAASRRNNEIIILFYRSPFDIPVKKFTRKEGQ